MRTTLCGHEILIDKSDAWRIEKYKYWVSKRGPRYFYFYRSIKVKGKWTSLCLHREIMATPSTMECDHRSGNTLDLRRKNLRNCNHSQNGMSRRKPGNNTSGYKGVSWHKKTHKWRTQIGITGRRVTVGYFNSSEVAYSAYCHAVHQHFGTFGRTA